MPHLPGTGHPKAHHLVAQMAPSTAAQTNATGVGGEDTPPSLWSHGWIPLEPQEQCTLPHPYVGHGPCKPWFLTNTKAGHSLACVFTT